MDDYLNWLQFLQGKLTAPIYLVGGAVRNSLLGFDVGDLDICGALLPGQIEEQLSAYAKVVPVNPRIGTVKIVAEGFSAEYTAFRQDSYPIGGTHSPAMVRFVATPVEDCLRRDFTVNAIYKRVSDGKLLDFAGGLKDLRAKLLRSVRAPQKVFGEDGLRLLRLVRFAAQLGFDVEKQTFVAAKNSAGQLKDISQERIREELDKILVADTAYGVQGAHYRGTELLRDLLLWQQFLPEITEGIGVKQNSVYHKYDVYDHIMHTVEAAPPHLRLAALFHDIAKPLCVRRDGNMHAHSVESALMTEKVMRRLRYGNADIARTVRLVRWHMFDFNGEAGENKKRAFVQAQYDVLEDICALKLADSIGTGCFCENGFAKRLLQIKSELTSTGVPITVGDLLIGGDDLVEMGVTPALRAQVLDEVLVQSSYIGAEISRPWQLKKAAEAACNLNACNQNQRCGIIKK